VKREMTVVLDMNESRDVADIAVFETSRWPITGMREDNVESMDSMICTSFVWAREMRQSE
jgi:hypothetical protein